MSDLSVCSIFLSIDGEANHWGQGNWAVFVRLAGCSARCLYCDTQYSWKEGIPMTIDEVAQAIQDIGGGVKKVTFTGGEPLEQDSVAFRILLDGLEEQGYKVSIETNGLVDFGLQAAIRRNTCFIIDYKLPSAGEHVCKRIKLEDFIKLKHNDYVKFVISDRKDFDYALRVVRKLRQQGCNGKFFFSPNSSSLKPETLFQWMKESGCPKNEIGFNLQIHKYIFTGDWRQEEG